MAKTKLAAILPLIILLLVGGVIWYFASQSNNVGTWEGAADQSGVCRSREGTTIGICCLNYDTKSAQYSQVACQDAMGNVPTQAFVNVNDGSRIQLPAIAFSVRVDNTGSNQPLTADVISVTTTGGTPAGDAEFNRAFQQIINAPAAQIPVGGTTSFGMSIQDPVRLSVPAFRVDDGTYVTTVVVSGTAGGTAQTQTATVTTHVEQERVGFSVSVQTA